MQKYSFDNVPRFKKKILIASLPLHTTIHAAQYQSSTETLRYKSLKWTCTKFTDLNDCTLQVLIPFLTSTAPFLPCHHIKLKSVTSYNHHINKFHKTATLLSICTTKYNNNFTHIITYTYFNHSTLIVNVAIL
jgi:hypothetical protein